MADDIHRRLQAGAAAVPERQLAPLEAKAMADRDLWHIRKHMWRQQLRKAVPPWSVPAEIWRLLLFPHWHLRPPRHGVGYKQSRAPTFHFYGRLQQLLTQVRMFNHAPTAWQTSMGYKIDKGNRKTGCAALRVVNSLDPLGKAFFAQAWQRGQPQSARHYASGYRQGKSRIEAIVQQHVVGYRLRQSKCSYNKCFFDVANAFYSATHDNIDIAVSECIQPEDFDLVKQRYRDTAVCIEARDGWACVRPQSGALQGDTCASDLFLEVYHPQIDTWNARSPQILVTDPITRRMVDVSLATYADDVSKIIVCEDANDLEAQVDVLNFNFDSNLGEVGMAQNTTKQEHVPCFCGPGARRQYKQILQEQRLPGSSKRSAKYLGGQQHHLDTCEDELQARESAARVSWATFGRLWSRSTLPKQALCLIFSGTVVAALLSGLEALTLSAAQLRRLDSIMLTYGRKLMRGKACRKHEQPDGSIRYIACTSAHVWQYIRLVPCEVELRVRRLRWLQNLARQPDAHSNVLAALFGAFPQDPRDFPSFSVETNPWAQQLLADVLCLGSLDSGAYMVEAMQSDLSRIFYDLQEEFLRIDVTELRAKFFSHEVPPPGWMPTAEPLRAEAEQDPVELPFECECLADDNSRCGARFATLQQLATHMRLTKGGNHGVVPDHFKAVITNQCPWCRVVHCNIRTTRQHVKSALQNKVCLGRGSVYTFLPRIPESLQCPVCERPAETLDELHDHITVHFVGPWIHVE